MKFIKLVLSVFWIFLLFLPFSCTTANSMDTSADTAMAEVKNRVIHRGIEFSLPAGWSAYQKDAAQTAIAMFKSDSTLTGGLEFIPHRPDADREALARYYYDFIFTRGKNGTRFRSLKSFTAGEAYYMEGKDEHARYLTLAIPVEMGQLLLHFALTGDRAFSVEEAAAFAESIKVHPYQGLSMRETEGFTFFSGDSSWTWIRDLGEGLQILYRAADSENSLLFLLWPAEEAVLKKGPKVRLNLGKTAVDGVIIQEQAIAASDSLSLFLPLKDKGWKMQIIGSRPLPDPETLFASDPWMDLWNLHLNLEREDI